MSTATADPAMHEPTTQAVVQQPDPHVLFLSKRSELRLVHTGRYPIVVPNTGQRLGETRGVTVAFREHEFRCPTEGEAVIMDPGGAGEARMPAADLLKFLEQHPRCGDPNEGFYRVDPKAPPISQSENNLIVQAATAWDTETLEEMVTQERAGWNRQELIVVAEGAIQRIREAEDRIRADQDKLREQEAQEAGQAQAQLDAANARAEAAERELEAWRTEQVDAPDAKPKPKAK